MRRADVDVAVGSEEVVVESEDERGDMNGNESGSWGGGRCYGMEPGLSSLKIEGLTVKWHQHVEQNNTL